MTLAQRIAYMFAHGEQGAWYDPSDLPTLFQDTAGTVPVTAVEQDVALMLDKSGRGNHASQATSTKRPKYSRRVNLLTSTEDFSGAAWKRTAAPGAGTASAPVVISNDDGQADKVTFDATGAGISSLSRSFGYSVASYAGFVRLKAATPGDVGKIVAFRHASGGAYLLITLTSEYQVVGRNETTATTYTGEYVLCTRPSVGTSSGPVAVHLAYASLTLAIDAHLPYQWGNTATDYDADPAKFPAYLSFDGVDDALSTSSIDFTGTDKMTVWAGVTKLSDAAVGVVAELDITIFLGGFYMAAPNSVGPTFGFASKGTVQASPTQSGHAAPKNAVLTGIGDISGDIASLRVNGVAETVNTDQGTGNYRNIPLYIGARAGTSLFFNGRLYQLIVRGAQSSLSQIEAVENLIRKTMRLP